VLILTPIRSFAAIIALNITVPSKPVESALKRDWWRTHGAAVVEHPYGDGGTACSLFFYSKEHAAVVTWEKVSIREISFYDSNWRFQGVYSIPVAVRLGETWLGGPVHRNPPHLKASTERGRLSIPTNEPVESLLRNAERITVQLADREMSIDVDRHKMPRLLRAVNHCRAALK
jgi:hypothetical protein